MLPDANCADTYHRLHKQQLLQVSRAGPDEPSLVTVFSERKAAAIFTAAALTFSNGFINQSSVLNQVLLCQLPQFVFLDLAAGSGWILVHKKDKSRNLVVGDLILTEFNDFSRSCLF